ncbi:hypothetical protein ACX0G9_15390 [Flavitalea flava]
MLSNDTMTAQFIISTFPLVIVGLAAVVSLVSFRNDFSKALRILSLFWGFNFFVDLTGHITKYYGLKNHWLYNIYFWIMYLVLAYLYDRQIHNKHVHQSIRLFYLVFPLLVLAESLVSGIQDLQTMVLVSGSVFMIFLAAAYFRQLYLSEETELITRDPWFWFSFGFIIYFGCTVPFLGMVNYLWSHYQEFTNFYYLYFCNSFAILLNLFIITGYLCRRSFQKSH